MAPTLNRLPAPACAGCRSGGAGRTRTWQRRCVGPGALKQEQRAARPRSLPSCVQLWPPCMPRSPCSPTHLCVALHCVQRPGSSQACRKPIGDQRLGLLCLHRPCSCRQRKGGDFTFEVRCRSSEAGKPLGPRHNKQCKPGRLVGTMCQVVEPGIRRVSPFPTPSENPPSPQLHIPFSFALSTHGGFNPPPPHHSLVRVHKPAIRRLDQLTTESKSPYRLRRSHVGSLRPQRAEAHNQTPITAPAATPVNRMREVGAIPSAWRAAKHM